MRKTQDHPLVGENKERCYCTLRLIPHYWEMSGWAAGRCSFLARGALLLPVTFNTPTDPCPHPSIYLLFKKSIYTAPFLITVGSKIITQGKEIHILSQQLWMIWQWCLNWLDFDLYFQLEKHSNLVFDKDLARRSKLDSYFPDFWPSKTACARLSYRLELIQLAKGF